MKRTISQFMWGYQGHFRHSVQYVARAVLKNLGASVDVTALLVGARRPGHQNRNDVCVEPEDGQWSVALFDGLLTAVEDVYSTHELQGIVYGDEPSTRDKPERMRRGSVSTAVGRALKPFDAENHVTSFVGDSRTVGDFYVVPVLQVPDFLFRRFPPLKEKPRRHEFIENGHLSLIHAALETILHEATAALQLPEPGRRLSDDLRRPSEIVRIAAEAFMHTPGKAISERYIHADLFNRINIISSLLYEGARGVGQLVLADPSNSSIQHLLRFKTPVNLHDPRWTRKVLQLAGPDAALIADHERVYGLGRVLPSHNPDDQDVFTVDFLDHYTWELGCGDHVLLRSHYGEPTLPSEVVEEDALTSTLARLFPASTEMERAHVWALFNAAARHKTGSMIVVAKDAESEAVRLANQGTSIEPVQMSVDLLRQASAIDGSILLDPHGHCHAIGVILDGVADENCTPSRGSRFNSAVRYVSTARARRLAIVVSDDRTVDVFPAVRPRQSRKLIAAHIAALEAATHENYHQSLNWLEQRRFYVNEIQCAIINAVVDRLNDREPMVGEIRIQRSRFSPDPDFDESYLVD
jgi:hypothetical protein